MNNAENSSDFAFLGKMGRANREVDVSWQKCVQEVVCKKADRKYATPDVAERPSKQARPRFQSLRWKNNALWSQRSNLSERLPSIDEDISSGAVVFGNPEKKARQWNLP